MIFQRLNWMIWWSLLAFTPHWNNEVEMHRLSVITQNRQPYPTNIFKLQWLMLWLYSSIRPGGCMEFRHVKSSDLSNLQPRIEEERDGISGLLIEVFRKFGTEAKSQRTGRNLMCNDTRTWEYFLYFLLMSNPLQWVWYQFSDKQRNGWFWAPLIEN